MYTPIIYKKEVASIIYAVVKEMIVNLDRTQPDYKNKEIILKDNILSFVFNDEHLEEIYSWLII